MYAETRSETGLARDVARRCAPRMGKVERHRLVPAGERARAYRNHPLPIGSGQTISQPYIVALSTDLLSPKPGDVVLEVGTGSGYQAAVLAEIVSKVYSIEIIESLGNDGAQASGRTRLRQYRSEDRRRLRGLAGESAVRRHRGHRGRAARAAGAGRPAQARRPHGDPGRRRGEIQYLKLLTKRADGGVRREARAAGAVRAAGARKVASRSAASASWSGPSRRMSTRLRKLMPSSAMSRPCSMTTPSTPVSSIAPRLHAVEPHAVDRHHAARGLRHAALALAVVDAQAHARRSPAARPWWRRCRPGSAPGRR